MRDAIKIARSCAVRAGKLQANTRQPTALVQALLRGHYLGVHVLVHHRQRGIAEFGIDMRDGVWHDDYGEVPRIGIKRGVEDALLGDLTSDDRRLVSSRPSR
jgi:hypothetical protein